MLEMFAKRAIRRFGRRWAYDTSYMSEIVDTAGVGAVLPLNALAKVGAYRRDVPVSVYFAAKITASIVADCGPCAQLCLSMAAAAGVNERTLHALASGDEQALRPDERLGVAFARAVLAREDPGALRTAIFERWGPRAVVSLAYALVAAQAYPTFKYATGHALACTHLRVGGEDVPHRERARV
jgi:hypothetical protein